jgi:hypothetical protein
MDDDTTPEPPGDIASPSGAPGSTGTSSSGSGNRWEPPAGAVGAPANAPYAAGPGGPGWRDRVRPDRLGPRARAGVAAGVAALVVAGLGGFAIGHATADAGGGDGGSKGHGFGQPFDDHDRDGFPPQGGIQGRPGGSTGELPGQQGSNS